MLCVAASAVAVWVTRAMRPLEGAKAFVVEAKLEGAALVDLGVLAGPHFAEAARAEFSRQFPAGATGDFQPIRHTPAECLLFRRDEWHASPFRYPVGV